MYIRTLVCTAYIFEIFSAAQQVQLLLNVYTKFHPDSFPSVGARVCKRIKSDGHIIGPLELLPDQA